MKVLFLSEWMGMGGIETNLVRLTREMTRRGHEVLLAARPGALVDAFRSEGGRFYAMSMSLRRPRHLVKDIINLRALIQAERPDVVHVFSASAAVINWLAMRFRIFGRRRFRWPVTVSSLMGLQETPSENQLKSYGRAFCLTLGSRRILLMAPALERFMHRLPIRRRRFARQNLIGVDTWPAGRRDEELISGLRRELGVQDNKKVIMTIGRLTAAKSHELFIEAARYVHTECSDACFVLIGDGPLRRDLELLVEESSLVGSFIFGGQKVDAARYIAAADVYVRPGFGEGFVGITALEAQAQGVPVVAYDAMDTRMAIRHNVTGMLAPAKDARVLAQHVTFLLAKPDEARRIGGAGRRQVEATFSIDSICDQVVGRYEYERDPRGRPPVPPGWRLEAECAA